MSDKQDPFNPQAAQTRLIPFSQVDDNIHVIRPIPIIAPDMNATSVTAKKIRGPTA
jgi:hypothetical protein